MPNAMVAVVTDVNDPLGQLRVRVDLAEPDMDIGQAWAPVMRPYFVSTDNSSPKVGDEVLVVFENGNQKWPVVLGCLCKETLGFRVGLTRDYPRLGGTMRDRTPKNGAFRGRTKKLGVPEDCLK